MQNSLFAKTLEVIARLNDEGVHYAVIGGVALNVHGLVRATEVLDIFVKPTEANVTALRRALRKVWDDPSIDEITAEDLCGDYPAIRYGPPDGSLPLDILARLGEFAAYDDLKVEDIEVEGVSLRVATPRTLLWLKAGTVRPRDHQDALALAAVFDLDLEEVGP